METIRGDNGIIDENIKLNNHNPIYIDETINLALCWNINFWHFQYYVLDKIYAMESNGFKGKYMVFDKNYILSFMKLMGISEDRIVYVNRKETYHIGRLHILENFLFSSTEMLIKTKERIMNNLPPAPENKKYPKRIYIIRPNKYSRNIVNEAEVINLLNKYNFQTFLPDDYSVEEQIRYFSSADIVVSPHGACCANALYMKPNSHFVECFSYT